MLKHLFQVILDWYQHALETSGYWVIALLMTMESSVLPLPSESIIPLAASWSHSGKIHIGLAGRPLLLRYGRYVLITPDKIHKAESWSAHYGAAGVFIARLLPGARQLVGVPAGIAKFDYLKFSIFTLLGAAIWCSVLCWLGVTIGADVSKGEMHQVMAWVGGTAVVLGGLYYFFVHRHVRKTSNIQHPTSNIQ